MTIEEEKIAWPNRYDGEDAGGAIATLVKEAKAAGPPGARRSPAG